MVSLDSARKLFNKRAQRFARILRRMRSHRGFFWPYGLPWRVLSTWRTTDQQEQLYARLGADEAAPPGWSQHEYGFAFDAQPALARGAEFDAALDIMHLAANRVGLQVTSGHPFHFSAFPRDTWRAIMGAGIPQESRSFYSLSPQPFRFDPQRSPTGGASPVFSVRDLPDVQKGP